MNRDYFQSLDKEKLVEVASNLHQLAVEQLERLEQNSSNSSRPPSSDNFYNAPVAEEDLEQEQAKETETDKPETDNSKHKDAEDTNQGRGFGKKPQGKQLGAKGMWRTTPLVATETVPHHPLICAACNAQLEINPNSKPHTGYYVLELEKQDSGIKVTCQLHHYYEATCECGHHTRAIPGVGYISQVEGRSKDLRLQEYSLVGPMLATFIASLAVRYRMSQF